QRPEAAGSVASSGQAQASDAKKKQEPAARSQAEPAGTAEPTSKTSDDPNAKRRLRTRMQVAKVMTASAAIPQFTANATLDLSKLAGIRKTDLGGASGTSILIKAQALALREHSELNAFWSDDGPQDNEEIGIAMAVDSPVGLLAPVIRAADTLSLSA